jgi:transcriptional regulator with XRE-family HTH domain
MLNNVDFLTRLETVMQFYDLTASAFADRIGVQRSSISHLLTGRNKPSLEFVLKVEKSFGEVDLYWLLYGKGHFPSKEKEKSAPGLFDAPVEKPIPEPRPQLPQKPKETSVPGNKTVDRIVFFYTDGTFEPYHKNG